MTKAELVYLSYEDQKEFIIKNDSFFDTNNKLYTLLINDLNKQHPDTIRGWALCLCTDVDLIKEINKI